VNGEVHHHVRVLAWRTDSWAVVGILQLQPSEWTAFARMCGEQGIKITDEPPIPTDTAAT